MRGDRADVRDMRFYGELRRGTKAPRGRRRSPPLRRISYAIFSADSHRIVRQMEVLSLTPQDFVDDTPAIRLPRGGINGHASADQVLGGVTRTASCR